MTLDDWREDAFVRAAWPSFSPAGDMLIGRISERDLLMLCGRVAELSRLNARSTPPDAPPAPTHESPRPLEKPE